VPEAALDSMRETRSRLVDSLQGLQRERAGDALESVLVEVDRTIGEMLAYVEDLRRTRGQLARGSRAWPIGWPRSTPRPC
jgi:hypothetical protein